MEKQEKYIFQNGFPQTSVISPLLFNVYVANLTETELRQTTKSDEIGIVIE